MTDYIKRSDAIHAVLHNEGQAAVASVQEIKAEDVAPVVHGSWFFHDVPWITYKCSVCNGLSDYNTPYCPRCGAKMGRDTE